MIERYLEQYVNITDVRAKFLMCNFQNGNFSLSISAKGDVTSIVVVPIVKNYERRLLKIEPKMFY
jgi:hypothetical protein